MKYQKYLSTILISGLLIISCSGCGAEDATPVVNAAEADEAVDSSNTAEDVTIDPTAPISAYYKDPTLADNTVSDNSSDPPSNPVQATDGEYTVRDAIDDYNANSVINANGAIEFNNVYGFNGMEEYSENGRTYVPDGVIVDRNVFVATYGDDSNPGTLDEPFGTIQKGIDSVGPGHTVFVLSGIYQGNIVFHNSGEEENVITLSAAPLASVTLKLGYGDTGAIIDLNGQDNICIRDLTLGYSSAEWVYAILGHGDEKNIKITNNDICNISSTNPYNGGGAYGILLYGEGEREEQSISGVSIDNNRVYNIISGDSPGIAASGNVEDITIASNIVYDITNIGIDIYGGGGYCSNPALDQPRNIVIKDNTVFNCVSEYDTVAGIYVDSARDTQITNNLLYENMYGIAVCCENRNDNYPCTNITVDANTIHNNHDCGITIGGYDPVFSGAVTNSTISNNIMYNNGDANFGWNGEIDFERCNNILVIDNQITAHDFTKPVIGCGKSIDYIRNVTFTNNLYANWNADTIKFCFAGKEYTGLEAWNKAVNGTDVNTLSQGK